MTDLDEIKKDLKTGKLVIGTEQTKNNLRQDKTKKVFLSSNCDATVKKELENLCSFNKVQLVQLKIPNDELGITCKKQFSISVLSLLK
ncbi:MAG: ribosomal L7Ae/L30e/S12e/Gadd45 family protein [Candidatus Woesearchaeota archaeon]